MSSDQLTLSGLSGVVEADMRTNLPRRGLITRVQIQTADVMMNMYHWWALVRAKHPSCIFRASGWPNDLKCVFVCVCMCACVRVFPCVAVFILFVRLSACDQKLTLDRRTLIDSDSCRGLDTNQAHSIGLPFSPCFFGMVIVTGTFKWFTQPGSVGRKCINMIQIGEQMIDSPRTVPNRNVTIRYQVGTNSLPSGQIVVSHSVTHFECRLAI